MFLNERGVSAPSAFLNDTQARARAEKIDPHVRTVHIAQALAAADHACLARAIDDAEAHGLIPHAARMRIVLAQRTDDRTQLERARRALEQLGDRQFLRRLERVAAVLT
jgi:hypothetical protein